MSNLERTRRVVYSQDITLTMKSTCCWLPVTCVLIAVLTPICGQALAEPKHPPALSHLGGVDSIIEQAVTDGNIPGAVLVVGHDGAVVYRKAYGSRALEPKREPMTLDTVFDLASLTKVIATTTAMMQLFEQGKVRMSDPVAKPPLLNLGAPDIAITAARNSGRPHDAR